MLRVKAKMKSFFSLVLALAIVLSSFAAIPATKASAADTVTVNLNKTYQTIRGFGGNCFLHIAVKGAGVHGGGELAAVDIDPGAVAVRLGILYLLAGGLEDDGGLLLPELKRHHLCGALEPRQRGQGKNQCENDFFHACGAGISSSLSKTYMKLRKMKIVYF